MAYNYHAQTTIDILDIATVAQNWAQGGRTFRSVSQLIREAVEFVADQIVAQGGEKITSADLAGEILERLKLVNRVSRDNTNRDYVRGMERSIERARSILPEALSAQEVRRTRLGSDSDVRKVAERQAQELKKRIARGEFKQLPEAAEDSDEEELDDREKKELLRNTDLAPKLENPPYGE